MKKFLILTAFTVLLLPLQAKADQAAVTKPQPQQQLKQQLKKPVIPPDSVPCDICTISDSTKEYAVGVGDILDINVLKPETLSQEIKVAPDGAITFPYIGSVVVKGRTIEQIQNEVQSRLGDGFMKYPVVSVSLKESLSRNFFVYGEVIKPGSYPMEENMSVLRAISTAGGFTRFGSSSHVKVLRAKRSGEGGYETITVNIKSVMDGNADEDVLLKQGDIVTVSEGVF